MVMKNASLQWKPMLVWEEKVCEKCNVCERVVRPPMEPHYDDVDKAVLIWRWNAAPLMSHQACLGQLYKITFCWLRRATTHLTTPRSKTTTPMGAQRRECVWYLNNAGAEWEKDNCIGLQYKEDRALKALVLVSHLVYSYCCCFRFLFFGISFSLRSVLVWGCTEFWPRFSYFILLWYFGILCTLRCFVLFIRPWF